MKGSMLVWFWLAAVAVGAPAAAPAPPNVVVILADDLGYGDIGPFGSKLNRTPNLDRLAAGGMKLTSFYAAPLCSASRVQLLTGCYAKRVSIPAVIFPVKGIGLHPEEQTIAELLKPLGYATICIGKWHLGDQPETLPSRHGFDHFFGLPYSNNMDGDGGKNPVPPLPLLRDDKVIEAPAVQESLTRRYTEEAVKFIAANRQRPFFLYLPHTAVHSPLHPGADFRGKSKNGPYGDWVEELDWSVGEVMAALREHRLEENTLVVFASDNGAVLKKGSNGPLRGAKGSTWEGGMRVPAIARWPGRVAAGSSCDAMMSELDLLPTIVGIAGGEMPTRKIDGVDVWPLLSGQTNKSPRETLFYFHWNMLEAVRSGPWKLAIATQKGDKIPTSLERPRLYNLEQDIGETRDTAADHPEIVARLKQLISAMDDDLGIGETRKKNAAPGVRPGARIQNPKPLL